MDKQNKKLKDHRQIGRDLDLFSFHDVAPGAVFWHPKGWIIYGVLQEFIREKLSSLYQEISTPVLVKSDLFKESGHWEFYKENIFNFEVDKETYSLKPMNCPEASLIFRSKIRSYQDLPIRFSEFGVLNRNELSGVLGGLFRVRQFIIDDAHHFIRPDQIQNEIHKLILLVEEFYSSFDFKPHFYFATKPDKAMGNPKLWEEAEKDLENALKNAKVKYDLKPKDGAFYGPKIDIHINDSQGRDWQLATIQLDFQIPEKMKLEYIDKDGKAKQPVIIHRAILGSLERFIGILTEHYQGAFPIWLSPVQVAMIPISEKHVKECKKILNELQEEGIRAEVYDKDGTMQLKVREATLQKVPYLVIIGDKEIKSSNVSIRTRDGKNLGSEKLSDFIKRVKLEIDKKI